MIARKSFLIVSTNILGDFLAWIGLIILSKMWGGFAPEALGTIAFAMSFVSFFNVVTNLGFNSAHIKRVSEGKDFGTCMGTYAFIKVILVSVMTILVLGSIFVWKNLLHNDFYDATTESVLIVVLFYTVFSELRYIALKTFKGTKEIAKLQITNIFENIVKLPLTIIVVIAGVSITGVASISPVGAWPEFLEPLRHFISTHAIGSLAMTYVVGSFASFFVGIWLLRKYTWKKPSWKYFKSYFAFALPMAIISIVSVISTNINKIMIGFFWTSTEVGYYFAVERVLMFVSIFYYSVSYVLFPTISECHSSNNLLEIKKTVRLAERYISMVMIPPIALIIVFVTPVIEIVLSSSFLPASPILIILLMETFITGITIPYLNLVSGINRPKILAILGGSICVTSVALNFLFVPKDGLLSSFGINGATGAAIATVLSLLINFFGVRIAAKKMTGIKLLQSHTIRHVAAGLVMGIVLYYIKALTPAVHWYILLGFAALGLGVYLIVLYLLREFNKDDFNFFIDIIHPFEMIRYIKKELKNNNHK